MAEGFLPLAAAGDCGGARTCAFFRPYPRERGCIEKTIGGFESRRLTGLLGGNLAGDGLCDEGEKRRGGDSRVIRSRR